MPQRFPGQQSAQSAVGFNIGIQLPKAGAGDTGGCQPGAPYIAWCGQSFPLGDDTTFVFAIDGLSEDAAVEWTWESEGGESAHNIVRGPLNLHVLVVIMSGAPGVVSATVDGVSVGSIAYSSSSCTTELGG